MILYGNVDAWFDERSDRGFMILYGNVNTGLMHGLMKGPIEVL